MTFKHKVDDKRPRLHELVIVAETLEERVALAKFYISLRKTGVGTLEMKVRT
jgi:hypothetical protein